MLSTKVCVITFRPSRQCFLSSCGAVLQYLSSLISHWRKWSRLWEILHLCHVTVIVKSTGEHVFIQGIIWVLTVNLWGAGSPTSSTVSSQNECACGPKPIADCPSSRHLSVIKRAQITRICIQIGENLTTCEEQSSQILNARWAKCMCCHLASSIQSRIN